MRDPIRCRCCTEQIRIFTITGGRIGEIRAVSDRLTMFAQLGWDWPSAD